MPEQEGEPQREKNEPQNEYNFELDTTEKLEKELEEAKKAIKSSEKVSEEDMPLIAPLLNMTKKNKEVLEAELEKRKKRGTK